MSETTNTKHDGDRNVRPRTKTAIPASGTSRATKKQRLVQLLSTKAGADVATLSDKLGWQKHTTRAALSGLRKAGFELAKVEAGGGKPTRYRIAAAPPGNTGPNADDVTAAELSDAR